MHTPWYNSNIGHLGEGELMRRDMEDLFFKHGVNIVLAGHVHSYERTTPTYQNSTNPCGPTYLNLGDGGNYEGAYAHWLPGRNGLAQPEWSSFRQGSFGAGQVEYLNSTHAAFKWHRHACYDADGRHADLQANCTTTEDNSRQKMLVEDEHIIVRMPTGVCPNQAAASAVIAPLLREHPHQPVVTCPICRPDELLNTTTCECVGRVERRLEFVV